VASNRIEKYIKSKRQTCMFFFHYNNEEWCIDASVTGGFAGLLSCSARPNCYSQIFIKENKPHLVIIANQIININTKLTINSKLLSPAFFSKCG
jgi:hypothetical protein